MANSSILVLNVVSNFTFIIQSLDWFGRFPRLIDEPETKEHIIRDLRGIVTGEKEYSHKAGLIKTKSIPSILKKVDYVKNNISELAKKHNFDNSNITEFKPMVVTIDYPPISEFNGVKMISIDEISSVVD